MGRRRNGRFKKIRLKVSPSLTRISLFLAVSLMFLGGLGYFIYNAKIFRIHSEAIESNAELSQKTKNKIVGKSLFNLELKEIVDGILQEHPEYKSVTVLKKFPHGLKIAIERRVAYAQIKGKKFYPIDREGVIVSDGSLAEISNLIIVEIPFESNLYRRGYQPKSKELGYIFDLIADMEETGFLKLFRVSSINALLPEALYFTVNLKKPDKNAGSLDRKVRVITGRDDFIRKLALLKDVVNIKFKDKLDLIQYIDLRYKEVYIGFDR